MLNDTEKEKAIGLVSGYIGADSSPVPLLTREERRVLERSENPLDRELLARYNKSPYRSNRVGVALGAAALLSEDQGNEDLMSRIREAREGILLSGSNEGQPVTQRQVINIQLLLTEVLNLSG